MSPVRFAHAILAFYERRPFMTGLGFLVLLGGALYLVGGLRIETSQLDLLPGDIAPVQDARRLDRLAGGAGYLVVTLSPARTDPADEQIRRAARLRLAGEDARSAELVAAARESYARRAQELRPEAELLKRTADRLAARLTAMDRVRYVRYRRETKFFRERAIYFWETEDLREALRRLSRKRDELIERADPFYIEIEKRAYRLDLSDLIARYRQKPGSTSGAYFLSQDGRMIMLLVKPDFPLDDIDLARDFLGRVQTVVNEELSRDGADPGAVRAGYTGTYAYYVEALQSVRESLRPAILSAFAGIALVLLIFLRRPVLVLILLVSLGYAVALTFGLTALLIGRLNLFTALFGGVLAGLGVDFGIHLIHRYLEEARGREPAAAMARAILTTGRAILFSAATTAAAFGVLMFTDFAGFQELGVIATVGILITVATMFLFTPYMMLLYLRLRPDAWSAKPGKKEIAAGDPPPAVARVARVVLLASVPLLVLCVTFAPRAGFDHDARNMLETELASIQLNIEVDLRFDVSGDPLVVLSSGPGEARALLDYLEAEVARHPLIARVVSVFQFVPDEARQRRNHALVRRFARESAGLDPSLLPPGALDTFAPYRALLNAKPFSVNDLPEEILREFRALSEGKDPVYLTFLYPDRGRMYRTEQILELEGLVGDFTFPLIDARTLERLKDDGTSEAVGEAEFLERVNRWDESRFRARGIFSDTAAAIIEARPFATLAELRALEGRARATGSVILMARFIDMIQAELGFILIGTMAFIVLFLLLSFRDLFALALCLAPLAAGTLATAALLGLLDLRVNFFSVAVFPVIIGYGIDNGIILYHRFTENGSAYTTLRRTAPAILASGFTTLAGWGSLSLAAHPGIRSMGLLACVGIACLVLVSLTVFPAVLRLVEERRNRTFKSPARS